MGIVGGFGSRARVARRLSGPVKKTGLPANNPRSPRAALKGASVLHRRITSMQVLFQRDIVSHLYAELGKIHGDLAKNLFMAGIEKELFSERHFSTFLSLPIQTKRTLIENADKGKNKSLLLRTLIENLMPKGGKE